MPIYAEEAKKEWNSLSSYTKGELSNGKYKQKLTNSYNLILQKKSEDINITTDDHYKLSTDLLNIEDEELIQSITTITSILNRNKEDSFYITYALLMIYNNPYIEYYKNTYNNKNSQKNKPFYSKEARAEAIKNAAKILQDAIKTYNERGYNKLYQPFEKLYKDIRGYCWPWELLNNLILKQYVDLELKSISQELANTTPEILERRKELSKPKLSVVNMKTYTK